MCDNQVKDKTNQTRKIGMADHPWEAGAYGTCKRCGTNPDTSFTKDQHPIRTK